MPKIDNRIWFINGKKLHGKPKVGGGSEVIAEALNHMTIRLTGGNDLGLEKDKTYIVRSINNSNGLIHEYEVKVNEYKYCHDGMGNMVSYISLMVIN